MENLLTSSYFRSSEVKINQCFWRLVKSQISLIAATTAAAAGDCQWASTLRWELASPFKISFRPQWLESPSMKPHHTLRSISNSIFSSAISWPRSSTYWSSSVNTRMARSYHSDSVSSKAQVSPPIRTENRVSSRPTARRQPNPSRCSKVS